MTVELMTAEILTVECPHRRKSIVNASLHFLLTLSFLLYRTMAREDAINTYGAKWVVSVTVMA